MVELLVVIAIIGTLIALIMPALGRARVESRRTACASTLRQVGLALRSYLTSSNDIFPHTSQFPSAGPFPLDGPDPVYLSDVLAPHAQGSTDVFHCPQDDGNLERPEPYVGRSYFATEKSSYEYRTFRFRGKTMAEVIRTMAEFSGTTFGENTIWIMRDYNNFHGTGGTSGSRRYLYYDGHVTDFENN